MNTFKKLKSAILPAGLLAAASAHAATLSEVPMQGGMVMPMCSYNANTARIQVMMPSTVPLLTPLLVSNPADRFDPADPWFSALDPCAEGASFSRRYGFMWDSSVSAPLPEHTEVWIRRLSSTPGINAYRYSGNEPKRFEPIFGTDGTASALQWNRLMFHPCFTGTPGTNTYTAQFELYLVNTNTSLEVPNSGSGAFTFNFNNLPDGRPALRLAPGVVVSWPAETTTNWTLECAPSANAWDWTAVTNDPVPLDGRTAVVLDGSEPRQFFRMRYVP